MLSTHVYWNLGAFESSDILNDTLQLPYADRIIDIDGIEVPTGAISSVKYPLTSPSVPLNFTAAKSIGDGALHSMQCGTGCTGIDNAFILDRPYGSGQDSMDDPQLIWTSAATGITMTLRTNQQSLQLYTCNGQNGSIKSSNHPGSPAVEKYGCMVIEPQQWIGKFIASSYHVKTRY